jgi:hypothetical protein
LIRQAPAACHLRIFYAYRAATIDHDEAFADTPERPHPEQWSTRAINWMW